MIPYDEVDLRLFCVDDAWSRIGHIRKHRQPEKARVIAYRKISAKINSAVYTDNCTAAKL